MSAEFNKPVNVIRFTAGCITVSFLSAVVCLFLGHISDVRGAVGSIGIMASFAGSGVAFWFAIRGRERKLIALSVLPVLPLGFWCWHICKIVYGS